MLAEHDVEHERRDYFGDPFTADELRTLLSSIGVQPSEIVSKRSRAYRELGLGDREVSEDELLNLMIEHPTLLRRPIVVKGNEAVIGFNKSKIEALIGA